ncbi:twin-arginine translocase TatA/TatE family subunit [Barnesiella sp. ET7]|uniref:Sec-independent protein translocase subunit TatA/TatB n=1 Tax=Barnesiella sp. ET7 TaxID=2972460 RepID=UPI0021AD40C4|nr:twin-arginine translocase TatA/TatE family subunit [Barnesiella sp. ET7]MCR8911279.1 twin-arginine translocase TatA/TatE family subunit [Barnesiella sp. ET7]
MNTLSAILLLFGNLGTTEIIIILIIFLLLFGGKKIPELMHGLGKGVRSFKKGMNELEDEINSTPAPDSKEKTKELPKEGNK